MRRLKYLFPASVMVLACCGRLCYGVPSFFALPEHLRPDPFGGIVSADLTGGHPSQSRSIALETARAAYVSCHLVVKVPAGEYRLEVGSVTPAASTDTRSELLEASLFREWFHYIPAVDAYYPDALIPIGSDYGGSQPDTDNAIPNGTAQAFWLDIWVPANALPGPYKLTARLHFRRETISLPIQITVLEPVVPAKDAVVIDHNSYGTSWFADQYPNLTKRIGSGFFESAEFFALIHAYHRIFYEHRGVFHQLGYGHAGKVGPEFAPALEGRGRDKHVSDWTLYDRHYGPLLDGSAFAGTHRGPHPIPFVYLPINPEWPASFEFWGEPGYEREFVNVVSEMEQHFRQKGWTNTRFEMFFNHKKRYRGFEWDGDEARFEKDYAYPREYGRLLKLAVPRDSPVQFVFRADVSWTMERQWHELAGIINFWVCNGAMLNWYPYAPQMLKERGDTVWSYGGTPSIAEPSSHITLDVLRSWMQGTEGFVRWETTAPGPDPWFHSTGETEALVYPGDRFGVAAPISSIRLKLERNAIQDTTLLESFAQKQDRGQLRAEAAKQFNQTTPAEWWSPRPPLANTNPQDWSNADIEDASHVGPQFDKLLDAAAWQRLRTYIYQFAEKSQ